MAKDDFKILNGTFDKKAQEALQKQTNFYNQLRDTVVAAAKLRKRDRNTTAFDAMPKHPFQLMDPPPGVIPPKAKKLAQDDGIQALNIWASNSMISAFEEGVTWLGYQYLSLLTQRPEYRVITETIAEEMTREWIKIKSRISGTGDPKEDKSDKITQLEQEFKRLNVREVFYNAAVHDGFFGRSHIYLDIELNGRLVSDDREELVTSIGDGSNTYSKAKVPKGSLKSLRNVEPIWIYPTTYDSIDPLKADWYNPTQWFVMGKQVHTSRIPMFVGHPVPDILKPVYQFGGLSQSQMSKPYIDIWLNTRQAVADLIYSFSVFILMTDLEAALEPTAGGEDSLFNRIQIFNDLRQNQGLMIINKESEELKNLAVPLGTLDTLQAQSQEHMACLHPDTTIKTNRGNIPICEVKLTDKVLTRKGWAPLIFAGQTGYAKELVEIRTANSIIEATPWHPIYLPSINEFVAAENVKVGQFLKEDPTWRTNMENQSYGVVIGGALPRLVITAMSKREDYSTALFGKLISDLSQKVLTFITKMMTASITNWTILNYLPVLTTTKPVLFIGESAPFVERNIKHSNPDIRSIAGTIVNTSSTIVNSVKRILTDTPVYNLEVAKGYLPEFYANGILVHNSISRIPLVKLLGISPHGLNASSEGEIRVFYDHIHAYQKHLFAPVLEKIFKFTQLSLWGEIDDDLVFDFVPLWSLDEHQLSQVRKTDAESDQIYVDIGVLHPEEVRKKVSLNPDSEYANIDVEDVPELKEEEEEGLIPKGMHVKSELPEEGGSEESLEHTTKEDSVAGLHHAHMPIEEDEAFDDDDNPEITPPVPQPPTWQSGKLEVPYSAVGEGTTTGMSPGIDDTDTQKQRKLNQLAEALNKEVKQLDPNSRIAKLARLLIGGVTKPNKRIKRLSRVIKDGSLDRFIMPDKPDTPQGAAYRGIDGGPGSGIKGHTTPEEKKGKFSVKSGFSREIRKDPHADPKAHEIQLTGPDGKVHYRGEITQEGPDLFGVGFVENVSREHSGEAPELYRQMADYAKSKGGRLIAGMNTNRTSRAVLEQLESKGLAHKVKFGSRELYEISPSKEGKDYYLETAPNVEGRQDKRNDYQANVRNLHGAIPKAGEYSKEDQAAQDAGEELGPEIDPNNPHAHSHSGHQQALAYHRKMAEKGGDDESHHRIAEGLHNQAALLHQASLVKPSVGESAVKASEQAWKKSDDIASRHAKATEDIKAQEREDVKFQREQGREKQKQALKDRQLAHRAEQDKYDRAHMHEELKNKQVEQQVKRQDHQFKLEQQQADRQQKQIDFQQKQELLKQKNALEQQNMRQRAAREVQQQRPMDPQQQSQRPNTPVQRVMRKPLQQEQAPTQYNQLQQMSGDSALDTDPYKLPPTAAPNIESRQEERNERGGEKINRSIDDPTMIPQMVEQFKADHPIYPKETLYNVDRFPRETGLADPNHPRDLVNNIEGKQEENNLEGSFKANVIGGPTLQMPSYAVNPEANPDLYSNIDDYDYEFVDEPDKDEDKIKRIKRARDEGGRFNNRSGFAGANKRGFAQPAKDDFGTEGRSQLIRSSNVSTPNEQGFKESKSQLVSSGTPRTVKSTKSGYKLGKAQLIPSKNKPSK